jgi:hypothetical protein
MPSSQGEFATCLTMSINRGELRALELRHSSTRKFDGEFGQRTQSYVGAGGALGICLVSAMDRCPLWESGKTRNEHNMSGSSPRAELQSELLNEVMRRVGIHGSRRRPAAAARRAPACCQASSDRRAGSLIHVPWPELDVLIAVTPCRPWRTPRLAKHWRNGHR